MIRSKTILYAGLVCCLALLSPAAWLRPAAADEGMWTFDNPPLKQLKEKYGFEPTKEWLDHVRLSSVRFNDGGSGSFVSPRGLVVTNHHVAAGQLQKASTPEHDYLKNGFYAKTQSEEIKCSDLELNVLVSYENVTERIRGAVKAGLSQEEALAARRAEMARISKESTESTGLRSDIVTLYQGGEYWLYRYKKYTDVRIVAAPEKQAAFFGGDPDNFTYPRYDLDFTLLRVYENNQPVDSSRNYLKWNARGAGAGELVFVSGHPGRTQRLFTMAQLETQRDHQIPATLKNLRRQVAALRSYAALGAEQARQAEELIFGLENSRKAYEGMQEGLLDKNLLAKKQREENEFRAGVKARPEWQQEYGTAWDEIAQSEQRLRETFKTRYYRGVRGYSDLWTLALSIVRYAAETRKPDTARLDGYHDAELESLRFELTSPAPLYPEMEEKILAAGFRSSLEELGPDDVFIKLALNGRTPEEVAHNLTAGTKLTDPAFRKSLIEGGEAAINGSKEPLLVLARTLDPSLRRTQKETESLQAPIISAGEKLGRARFAVYGKSLYPDATFTLRLSYGTIKTYPMNGTQAPLKTTFYGLYDRALSFDLKPPFDLPARLLERKDRLDLATPFNFISTPDIIGGNSGSPVINRQGEFVGLVFDGNIESLVGNYIYNEENNRTVSVHSAAIIEALRKLYDASPLADELEGKASRAAAN
ncbi:MAG TPA: S46 family peptidase [Blastocatellia bacterium]|nr:S46 family peptidase [Blastocatellia bacterium]